MNLELDNKNVLVTGASRGIGLAIAESFLKEGANVMIVSRGSNLLSQTASILQKKYTNVSVEFAICDCAKQESLEELLKIISKKWSKLDIVVSNVGDGRSEPDPIPANDQWRKTWSKNFESALFTSRVFLPSIELSRGCLLFISSIAGFEVLGAPIDYSTAKSAMISFAKNLSRKVTKDVRVNVIAPGNIIFPGSSWDKKMDQDPVGTQALIDSSVPMKRFGNPREVADLAVFICSERAKFITGSVFVIDGGQTVSS